MDVIMNQHSRTTIQLCDYIDRLLKQKTVVKEDLETHLAKVISLFRFIQQKGTTLSMSCTLGFLYYFESCFLMIRRRI